MSAVASIALALAASVVKSAAKIWLGDRQVAADLTASAIDILVKRVDGPIGQRRAKRFFEEMEEAVAGRLEPLLQHEFRKLPDNERLAAFYAVRITFDHAALKDADLFAVDLDTAYLAQSLRVQGSAVDAQNGLSTDARAVYDWVLRECCAYVIEVTRTLPRFGPLALTEVLRRQSAVLEQLNQVLARLPERQGNQDFETDYRQQVVNVLDRVEFFGAALSSTSRRYPLSVAYISLNLMTRSSSVTNRATSKKPEPPSVQSLSADQAIFASGSRRLFIRGEAGAGKSTLLQWLAVRTAARDLPEHFADWREVLPFLVRLRHYATRPLPRPERFVQEVGRNIAVEMPRGWVQKQLKSGRAVVLIDGVDELPKQRREEAGRWLRDLVASFKSARFIVTSRNAAVPPNWLEAERFNVADIQPMTPSDVTSFVQRWHRAVAEQSMDSEERQELAEYEGRLIDTINCRRSIRQLATNPLLCALLCGLHRDRRGRIPSNRMDLYREALQMLLERRDAERDIPAIQGLSHIEKTLLLQDVAFWLLRNGEADAEKVRIIERIRARLQSMPQVVAPVDDVFTHLLERTGVIREPIVGRIDFIHRTFQEYLAAKAAIEADDIGLLVERAHLDQWYEVIVMAAGHASRKTRETLLDRIVSRAEISRGAARDQLRLLTLACLETSPELDLKLRKRILERTASLLPPKTPDAVITLARAGEFIVDLLAQTNPTTETEVNLTVRAAAQVGGEPAMHLIARFRRDNRLSVRQAIVEAWRRFNPEAYAQDVLAHADFQEDYVPIRDGFLALLTFPWAGFELAAS